MSRSYDEIERDAFEAIRAFKSEPLTSIAQELDGREDPVSVGLRHLAQGYTQYLVGDAKAAAEEFTAGAHVLEGHPYSTVKAELVSMAGAAYARLADQRNAMIWMDRHLRESTDAGNEAGIGAALSNIGVIHFDCGTIQRRSSTTERLCHITNEVVGSETLRIPSATLGRRSTFPDNVMKR